MDLTQLLERINALNAAHAEFKASVDANIKNRDVVTEEKIAKLNATIGELQAAIDQHNLTMAAISANGGRANRTVDAEYTEAFVAHIRRGDIKAALSKGTAADGGFLAPTEWDRTITDRLKLISPMRQLATVQTISVAAFSKLFNNRQMASGWVGEAAARPETNTPQFSSLNFTAMEIYANPAATQGMLDDALVDLEAWIAGEVDLEFAAQEGAAFVSGNAATRPNGILTYVTGGANAALHPFGAIPVVNSGAANALTADGIVNLVYSLPSAFIGNASFAMNRDTHRLVRLLKDGQGNYLWQPSYQAGQPATLLGYPITELPDMPNVAANAHPILFGDFRRTYLILDRVGTRTLRDPYTNKPFVMFYVTKRVGGGVMNPEPMRAQRIAA